MRLVDVLGVSKGIILNDPGGGLILRCCEREKYLRKIDLSSFRPLEIANEGEREALDNTEHIAKHEEDSCVETHVGEPS